VGQQASRVLRSVAAAATSGGSQNFLGAAWVEGLLGRTPPARRESVALFLLSLSPHYFYASDRRAEAERNRVSRQGLVRDIVLPYLSPTTVALDFGCGPGYMAAAVAPHVAHVEAVDVSPGVLACARVLNGAPTIVYETTDEAAGRDDKVDVAYSFAVVQHLSDETCRSVLTTLHRRLRDAGRLLVHSPVPDAKWRTEEAWRSDQSLRGRARLRFGLNCFGRDGDHLCRLAADAGFRDLAFAPLAGVTDADPDIASEYLLTARA
jgi:SAM-dependent methyltransferase